MTEKNIDLSVDIAGLKLENPVIGASGTFGFGREFADYMDLNRIGGISVKGLTLEKRQGNKPPRIAETPAGILNSVGLQNPGVKAFIENEIPFLRKFSTKIIANIAGNTIEDYCSMAEQLSDADIDAIELNVSCPNVKKGCVAFGNSTAGISEITGKVKKYCKKPLIVKLTPNVTDVKEIAVAAEDAGADAISLINTILGMAIDIHRKRPILANNVGGLSGPAVKPIAVRMVYEVASVVKIPVIGMGGISSGEDAVEFMLAGASAVMVGTANFINPTACVDVVEGIKNYLKMYNHSSVYEIIGKLQLN
ncbi:dihydroorotate dehydrogenase [Acetivibrio mesophilus]|uniref:Dihydroorotate dehydrogenase n=1 Tax=Acetivibrio mesophilus TaxID=2487273 RepID=A0A4Q0I761_9FIRM|nr:dihydroorotate dehydrogenase [Acetivibrio mesophilus]ODM25205.1 dihydroorotate dehydrogenase B catalytic subunit [Clostridium sp. Bc-iso-3]RXE59777.1 dihydroorotate dehydrogenase [Acetivibrio mesophilus]HHV29301.1 dihydroorotate dehydrogenase [Clostridium sp.]